MSKILKQALLSLSCLSIILGAPACSWCRKHKEHREERSKHHGRHYGHSKKSSQKEY